MSFLETPRFSDRIARNMVGGPEFSTEVVVLASGVESRNQAWSQARRSFDAAVAVRTLDDFAEIEGHFHACAGRAIGFRFKDFGDFTLGANGLLRPLRAGQQAGAAGFGFGEPTYQIVKRYTRGARTHDRDIRKPVAGTVVVTRGGVPVVQGAGAGQCAVDTTTGLVLFVADQTRSITSHTVGSLHSITLASAFSPNLPGSGGRVYVTGVTGTAAALLNNLSHNCTVSGANITLTDANTAGLTATGGTALFYPQPSEALAAAGEFDVPVRFDSDRLVRRVLGRSTNNAILVECDSIPVIEVRV